MMGGCVGKRGCFDEREKNVREQCGIVSSVRVLASKCVLSHQSSENDSQCPVLPLRLCRDVLLAMQAHHAAYGWAQKLMSIVVAPVWNAIPSYLHTLVHTVRCEPRFLQ